MAAENQVFAWEGKDKSGRKTKGEITSRNANVAKAAVRPQMKRLRNKPCSKRPK